MGWLCRKCETENLDELDLCEVCDAQAPRILDFTYNKILVGDTLSINWHTELCETVIVEYGGNQIDVTGKDSLDLEINNPDITDVVFLLSNDVTDKRSMCFSLDFMHAPIIELTANVFKIRKNKQSNVVLSWWVKNAKFSFLKYGSNVIEIPEAGCKTMVLDTDCVFTVEATALDGITIFSKQLTVEAFDECEIEFNADKTFIFPRIPVVLTWEVKHAKKVWLNGKFVKNFGQKVVEPSKATTFVLRAEDEFGKKEKHIDIKMLPIPQIQSLLVPAPNLGSNLSITIKQPKLSVEAKFPKIDLGFVKTETPRAPSLTDLGINVELINPKKSFSLKETIKKIYNYLTE